MPTRWTTDNVEGPPDIDEMRRLMRRSYVQFLRASARAQRIRDAIDLDTADRGKRAADRKNSFPYQDALSDINMFSNEVYVYSAMIGTEIGMQDRQERVRERRSGDLGGPESPKRIAERATPDFGPHGFGAL